MDTKSKPIYGCLQYPHVEFETEHNPNMDVSQIIAYHLTALMASSPDRDTLAKVAKAAKVGFGTVQRAKNGDGNLTVQNLAQIAAAFHHKPGDLLVQPSGFGGFSLCAVKQRLNGAGDPLRKLRSRLESGQFSVQIHAAIVSANRPPGPMSRSFRG